ncbi:MAG: cobalamin-dependent protein [Deltaproteobacteria bacterium]|nr:cobalamin-dependent protein [Deltaproteobacteria bacterium]MBW2661504.1 cobalamin-dependent protein [Deltaproteobacteria bacterium]
MAKIFLIQPSLTANELYARGSKTSASLIPPLGIAYIASYLHKYGHKCRILDGVAEPLPLEKICEIARDYDIVGITVVSTYAVRAIELIQALKKHRSSQLVVVGGPHVTVMPESLLEQGADYAVIGEGEVTMYELVERLSAGGRGLKEVPGIVFSENGQFVYTPPRIHIDPLDQVPLPARHLLPMHLYKNSVARSTRQPSHSMLASRGCPGVCTFCSKKTFGTRTRYFSIDRIVEEFFLLHDKYGAKDVAVWDDNFVTNHEIVFAVCEQLKKRNFNIPWSVESRIDVVNRKVLYALKEAGCTFIAYGIESGSQRVLDHINKQVTKEKIVEAIHMTKEVGIQIRGYFMLGLSTETKEEMEDTIRFAMELDTELASFTIFVPLPGTAEYRRALKSGTFVDPKYYLHKVVPEFNFLDYPIYVPEGMTAGELLSIHRSAYNRYYFRPRFLLRKLLSIRSPDELANLLYGGLTLIKNAVSKS